jgi:hypothetical protein
VGPEKRLTALSVNAAPDEGRRPASGARPPGRILRTWIGCSEVSLGLCASPGVFPVRCPGSFLCIARGPRRSSPELALVRPESALPPERVLVRPESALPLERALVRSESALVRSESALVRLESALPPERALVRPESAWCDCT